MEDYRIDVRELFATAGLSETVTDPFPLDAVRVGDEVYTLLEPAAVDVLLTSVGSGVVASGSVTAHVLATCSRCICEFETTIVGEVECFYVAHGVSTEADEAERADADEHIDLAPALTAALVLEAPFAPVHDPECAGLCPTCGADLNEGGCACHAARDDSHPFSQLRGLFGPSGTDDLT